MLTGIFLFICISSFISSADAYCDSHPDCVETRNSEGHLIGVPCCLCRYDYRCHRGERFEPLNRVPRCCSGRSRVTNRRHDRLHTHSVSERRHRFVSPSISEVWQGVPPPPPPQEIMEVFPPSHQLSPFDETTIFQAGAIPDIIEIGAREATRDIPATAPRIIGGFPGPAPYTVGIQRLLPGGMRSVTHCGGTILTSHYVVTAAHCFYRSRNPAEYVVMVGDADTAMQDPSEQRFRILRIIMHPQFIRTNSGSYDYDIALVQLVPINGQGIRFDDNVQRVFVPSPRTRIRPQHNCQISGWGRTSTDPSGPASRFLLVARISVLGEAGQRQCNIQYNNLVTDRMLCAGPLNNAQIDTCAGDSGGPLVCNINGRSVLVGITSWGTRVCATRGYPGVYTDVQRFLPWLRNPVG